MPKYRIFLVSCFLSVILCALDCRLAYLQLSKGKQLAAAAVAEHVLCLPVANFFRGDIKDCRGESLLDVKKVYSVAIFPSFLDKKSFSLVVDKLFGNLSPSYREQKLRDFLQEAISKGDPFMLPVTLHKEEIKTIAEMKISGVYLVPLPRRYGDDSLARHLVGYVKGDVLQGELQKGIKGIEAVYNDVLAPSEQKLELLTVIDRSGKPLKGLGLRLRGSHGMIIKGKDVILTLDAEIQRKVENIMDRYRIKGAVSVVDVATGEVRALASRPLYDQNSGIGDQFDRSLALYHPGSVFKIVVAAAAMAEGKVQPEEHFNCSGGYRFKDGSCIGCWKKEGHGDLTFREAFATSCNSVFVDVALRLGGKTLEHYARLLGLEEGLEGYLPRQKLGEIRIGSYHGDVGNAALGQDGVLISPLNAAVLAATIARCGIYLQPRIVKAITDADGRTEKIFCSAPPMRVLPAEVARELQKMMELTVQKGTGKRAFFQGLSSAGKTGSAETGRYEAEGNAVTDAWFVGYAPADCPQLAVAVVVEGGGAGGGIAAEIFREILSVIYHLRG